MTNQGPERSRENAIALDEGNYPAAVVNEIDRAMTKASGVRRAVRLSLSWEKPNFHVAGFQTKAEQIIDIVRDIQKKSPQYTFQIFGTPSDHTVNHLEIRIRSRR